MSQNDAALDRLARPSPDDIEIGIIRLTVAAIVSLMVIPAIPIFVYERLQPMIKYRSWTINIFACVSVMICHFTTGFQLVGIWVAYDMFYYANLINNIFYTAIVCVFLPTYLRHYFLLRLSALQKRLLTNQDMLDPAKYQTFKRDITLTKFFSSEMGAVTFFAINFIVSVTFTIYCAMISNVDMIILDLPTPLSKYIGIMPVVQIFISQGFLLWYGPRSPKDNYNIMNQFYIITGTTLMNVIAGAIKGVSSNRAIFLASDKAQIIISLVPVFVNIAIPLQFIVTKRRYTTSLNTSGNLQPLVNDFNESNCKSPKVSIDDSGICDKQSVHSNAITPTSTTVKSTVSFVQPPTSNYNLQKSYQNQHYMQLFARFCLKNFPWKAYCLLPLLSNSKFNYKTT
ncbi:hypothetical protein MT418_001160 [Batrachochytrium dendrobatidis]